MFSAMYKLIDSVNYGCNTIDLLTLHFNIRNVFISFDAHRQGDVREVWLRKKEKKGKRKDEGSGRCLGNSFNYKANLFAPVAKSSAK